MCEPEDAEEIRTYEDEIDYFQSRKKLFLFNPDRLNMINQIVELYETFLESLKDDYEANYFKAYIRLP